MPWLCWRPFRCSQLVTHCLLSRSSPHTMSTQPMSPLKAMLPLALAQQVLVWEHGPLSFSWSHWPRWSSVNKCWCTKARSFVQEGISLQSLTVFLFRCWALHMLTATDSQAASHCIALYVNLTQDISTFPISTDTTRLHSSGLWGAAVLQQA